MTRSKPYYSEDQAWDILCRMPMSRGGITGWSLEDWLIWVNRQDRVRYFSHEMIARYAKERLSGEWQKRTLVELARQQLIGGE